MTDLSGLPARLTFKSGQAPKGRERSRASGRVSALLVALKLWVRRLVILSAVVYPLSLLATIVAFRFVGERWWLTAAGLYLPRAVFASPLPFVALAALLCRERRLALLQLLSVALVLFPLMGLVVPIPRLSRGSGLTMRILSFNVNNGQAGQAVLLAAIERYSPDLVLLQETYPRSNAPLVAALRARYPSVDATDQFIVASRWPLSDIKASEKVWYDGRVHSSRYMRYTVGAAPNGALTVYNIHPVSPRQGLYSIRGAGFRKEMASGRLFEGAASPVVQANSGLRAAELDALSRDVRTESGPVVVAGDTNLPGLSPILARLSRGYQDGFEKAGWGFGYTFPAKMAWMRIDRMLASSEVSFEHFEVGCAGASDHLCVVADVQVRPAAHTSR